MERTLHITSGDCAGELLAKTGIAGEIFVWRDILYDGLRNPGWPNENTLAARALFLEQATGGGMQRAVILEELKAQYRKLEAATEYEQIVLWFDGCLFDQSMLAHVLTCLRSLGIRQAELLCIDAFPGIEPFDGLSQLTPQQLASLYGNRQGLTEEQFNFAEFVDSAFARQDMTVFDELEKLQNAPLPWVPAAAARWLDEQPDEKTGLGCLQQLALDAIGNGSETLKEIFVAVSAADVHPQYWGDSTLWEKINSLADHNPPLVRIEGPAPRVPQWQGEDLKLYRVTLPREEITSEDA
ncbi:MAG: DUF1835 domain-containing protein [Amphritea sp.]